MARKKKIAYWLLPVTALCLTGAILSVGESQARYDNRALWHTVAEPSRPSITSNYLQPASKPLQTVLLGQMAAESRDISFVMNSTSDVSGALTWNVDKPEYLEVQVKNGETALISGDTVTLDGDVPVTVTMTLTPTQKAEQIGESLDVNIQVAWSDALAGSFRAELMPKAEDEPEGTQPPATEPDAPEDEAPDQEPENTDPQPTVTLEGLETYHPELMFPLQISSPTAGQIPLKLLSGENIQNFPQGTRFSLDDGATWYMLYHEGEIPLDVPADEPVTVMLDLSATTLVTEPSLTFTADGASVTLTANTEPVFWMSRQVLTKNTEIIITVADLWADCELVCSVDMLVSTENGKAYEPAEISRDGLLAEVSQKENKQQLSIRVGNQLPQPGTYRVNLSWHYKGICIWQTRTNFFINYTGNIITNQTGGDRQ